MKTNSIKLKSGSNTIKEPNREINMIQDLIAGAVAGSASVVVGHPFDTIKVRLQTCTSSVISLRSFGSLYRGLYAPLSTISMTNAVKFSAYGYASRMYDDVFGLKSCGSKYQKDFVCGCFSGFMKCFIVCPMEVVKCRLQIESTRSNATHLVSRILEKNGVQGLFQGFWSTFFRECPALGVYFGSYNYIKDYINSTFLSKYSSQSNSLAISSFAGGFSGMLTWFIVYPIDTIKTRIQTTPLNNFESAQFNMWLVGKSILSTGGWRKLYRGLGITLIRAFPVNAIIFPMYEFSLAYLSEAPPFSLKSFTISLDEILLE